MASFGLLLISGAWPVVAVAAMLLGAYYTTRPMAVSAISAYVSEHQRGVAYALVDTLAGLAAVLGTNLAGVLYTSDAGWPFVAGIACGVGTLVLGLVLLRRPDLRNASDPAAYSPVESK
jgi:MFS family permease